MFDRLKSNLFNLPGWHTKRKIVIFESDDWGSIRIPSRETHTYLSGQGYPLDKSPYGYDCLESNDDLTALLEVLSSSKNVRGQKPIFTLNNIVANPDFERIHETGFEEYFFEPFFATYDKYANHNHSFRLLKEGIENRLFLPQLHGREHLNIYRWLNSLRAKDLVTIEMFKYQITSLPNVIYKNGHNNFQRAFDYSNAIDKENYCQIISEACQLFTNIWGFKSISFIAPNFFWDDEIEKCLSYNGIKYIQGQRAQFLTDLAGDYSAKYHFTGQRNSRNQLYLIRNCYFEPSFDPSKDYVNSCLKDINDAFRFCKPAIISSHRVNYIGEIDEMNRGKGLSGLQRLLTAINKKWSDVEYMSTNELGDYISKSTRQSD